MNDESDIMPKCRQCPGQKLEFIRFMPSRYMAVCHATETVLTPIFMEKNIRDCLILNKANMSTVEFAPLVNCPYVIELRNKGLLPWADASINFLKNNDEENCCSKAYLQDNQ